MTLGDVSKLLAAYDRLYYACRCLDHMHPPRAILPEMREVWRIKQDIGYDSQAQPATEREGDTMKARKLAALLNTRYIVHDGGETIKPLPPSRILKDGEVAVPKTQWTVAQILANAWSRNPLKCDERDKLVSEWDAMRSSAQPTTNETRE